MRLFFKTAPELKGGNGTDHFDNQPVEVLNIIAGSWYVQFPNGERLHAFPDELFIKE